ncbi:unnamed protein product [Echinostoma caproni]|uniref:Clr2_transil domain-containing protein n=1 Tax=Echinostoma caproni TaxID=27848 RepID=A0A183AGM5_9TREM|nr:unnamed protein product [Echinostoma caproni]
MYKPSAITFRFPSHLTNKPPIQIEGPYHGSNSTDKPCDAVPGRYYHLFTQGELESLISQVPSLKLHRVYYERGNWAAVVTKSCMENTQPL